MSEDARLVALVHLQDLRRQDESIDMMVQIMCAKAGVGHIGEFARNEPAVFDEVYEQALAMAHLDDELEQYVQMRGTLRDGQPAADDVR